MRTFSVDARYERFVNAKIVLVLASVGRDMQRRARGDEPTIPDNFVDGAADGRVLVITGLEHEVLTAGQVPARRRKMMERARV
jgi:hypothetical protein